MAPEVRLRLPEPGSFEELLRPARIDVASLVRLSRYGPPSRTGDRRKTLVLADLTGRRTRPWA